MEGSEFVATVVGDSELHAWQLLESCLPDRLETTRLPSPSANAEAALTMIAHLEEGDESSKSFAFSETHLSGPMYRIYNAAAQIPMGYITTYGAVARVAHSEARAVGRAMATNPLYPIVPCHRVIGSDFAMVGYGGRQDEAALSNKYGRLEAEVQGHSDEHYLDIGGAYLPLYPVEWALEAAREADARTAWRKHRIELEQAEAEAQLSLF